MDNYKFIREGEGNMMANITFEKKQRTEISHANGYINEEYAVHIANIEWLALYT